MLIFSRICGFRISLRRWFHIQQLYVKHQGRIRWDPRYTRFAVSQFWWNNQFDLTAFLDVLQTFCPTWDNTVQTERERFTTGVRVVELFTVDQRTL